MNLVVVSGRIPFDVRFFEGKDDKKAFASFTIGIQTGNKTPEGYPEEELYRCNAWGYSAEHVNKYFQKGDRITFEGSLMKGQPWEKDGVTHDSETELRVVRVDGFGTKNNSDSNETASKPATKPAAKPSTKPAAKPATAKPSVKPATKPATKRPTAPAPKK